MEHSEVVQRNVVQVIKQELIKLKIRIILVYHVRMYQKLKLVIPKVVAHQLPHHTLTGEHAQHHVAEENKQEP